MWTTGCENQIGSLSDAADVESAGILNAIKLLLQDDKRNCPSGFGRLTSTRWCGGTAARRPIRSGSGRTTIKLTIRHRLFLCHSSCYWNAAGARGRDGAVEQRRGGGRRAAGVGERRPSGPAVCHQRDTAAALPPRPPAEPQVQRHANVVQHALCSFPAEPAIAVAFHVSSASAPAEVCFQARSSTIKHPL